MNTLSAVLLLTSLAACCSAGLLKQDFSTTDEQGGYHFGFNDGYQARQEERTPEGVVRGAYRYVDANGETQTITYTADSQNGFLASGSSIPKVQEVSEVAPAIAEVAAPVAVEDTLEVKAARAEHLEAHKKALIGEVQGAAPAISLNQFPVAVQYNPQLLAAPSQHVYAVNQQLIPQGGYLTYASQPAVQYIIQGSQYHPDYQPYAAL